MARKASQSGTRARPVRISRNGMTAIPRQRTVPRLEEEPMDPEYWADVSGDPGDQFGLENADPSREYMWAVANGSDQGTVSAMRRQIPGYVVETYKKDGVRAKGDADEDIEEGKSITRGEHVLMSCDKAKRAKRRRYESKRLDIEQARLEMQGDINLEGLDTEEMAETVANYRTSVDRKSSVMGTQSDE